MSTEPTKVFYDTAKDNSLTRKYIKVKQTPKKTVKEYVCPRCKDPFRTNKDLRRHIKKAKKCEVRDVSSKVIDPCICGCGAIFSLPFGLRRHLEKCSYTMNQPKGNPMTSTTITTNSFLPIYPIHPYDTCEYHISNFPLDDLNIFLQLDDDYYLAYFKIIFCSQNNPQRHCIFYPPGQSLDIFIYTTDNVWEKQSATEIIDDILYMIRDRLIIYSQFISYRNDCKNIKKKLIEHIKSIDKKRLNSENSKNYNKTISQLRKNIRLILEKHSSTISLNISNNSTREKKHNTEGTTSESPSNTSSESSSNTSSEISSDMSYDSSTNNSVDEPLKKTIIKEKVYSDDEFSYNSSDIAFDSSSETS